MKTFALVTVLVASVATIVLLCVRDSSAPIGLQLDREYREMRHRVQTSALPPRNQIVEQVDDWVEVYKRAGLKTIADAAGSPLVEVYRVTYDRSRTGKVTVVTAILSDHPNVQVVEWTNGSVVNQTTADFSFDKKTSIRNLMAAARFWDLEFYSGESVADGTMLFLEGGVNGRYRRLQESNLGHGFLHAICSRLSEECGIEVPSDE